MYTMCFFFQSRQLLESENSLKVKVPMRKKKGIKMKLRKVVKDEEDDSPPASPRDDSPSPPPTPRPIGKPRKAYGSYTQEDLMSAVRAIKEEGLSVYKAADMYGVPKSTLHDKVGNTWFEDRCL